MEVADRGGRAIDAGRDDPAERDSGTLHGTRARRFGRRVGPGRHLPGLRCGDHRRRWGAGRGDPARGLGQDAGGRAGGPLRHAFRQGVAGRHLDRRGCRHRVSGRAAVALLGDGGQAAQAWQPRGCVSCGPCRGRRTERRSTRQPGAGDLGCFPGADPVGRGAGAAGGQPQGRGDHRCHRQHRAGRAGRLARRDRRVVAFGVRRWS